MHTLRADISGSRSNS